MKKVSELKWEIINKKIGDLKSRTYRSNAEGRKMNFQITMSYINHYELCVYEDHWTGMIIHFFSFKKLRDAKQCAEIINKG